MDPERFFDLFLLELEHQRELWNYYKYLKDPSRLIYRKAYFCRRLEYVKSRIPQGAHTIWDCGCGFGTTGIFLAMNGIAVHGTTIEHYYRHIPRRLEYWSQYGDTTLFTAAYEDLYASRYPPESFDTVILQDTLHHTEPIDEALSVFHKTLKPGGFLVVIEENGHNIIQCLKLFLRRGNKRIVSIYDEGLQRRILLGNENIRSVQRWKRLLSAHGFSVDDSCVEYIRYYLPFQASRYASASDLVDRERLVRSRLLHEYMFFGINFVAYKS